MERTLPPTDNLDLKPSLTPRQARFVEEYLKDLNGTQAAIRTGYSPATANEQASRLLTDVKISGAVERAKATRSARVNVTQDEVLSEIAILATACVEHYIVDDDGYLRAAPDAPEGVMRAVQSVDRKSRVYKDKDGNTTHVEYEIKFKLWDKPGQLKLLGRHAGVKATFDRVEVSGPDGGPIEWTNLSDEEIRQRALAIAQVATTLPSAEEDSR